PPQIREAYPRTLLSLSTISLGGEERMEAKRLFPDGTDELLISDSLDNCDTLPARAVVMAIQAPLISRPTPPANNNLPLTPEQEWAQKLNIPAPETSLPPVPDSDNTPQQSPLPYQQNDMMNQPVNNMTGPTQHPGEAPNSYLLWSILSLVFCCFIPSIVAIFYSAQVNSRFYAGDLKGSQRASRNAQIWIIVSIVLGVVSSTLYFPLMLLQ
ncbi:MAG: CD225/dispanin family protein, partial [Muribaculaceae bacterium]|nr:CD225/dispanin family protein [Muribaculaceae bacterium]